MLTVERSGRRRNVEVMPSRRKSPPRTRSRAALLDDDLWSPAARPRAKPRPTMTPKPAAKRNCDATQLVGSNGTEIAAGHAQSGQGTRRSRNSDAPPSSRSVASTVAYSDDDEAPSPAATSRASRTARAARFAVAHSSARKRLVDCAAPSDDAPSENARGSAGAAAPRSEERAEPRSARDRYWDDGAVRRPGARARESGLDASLALGATALALDAKLAAAEASASSTATKRPRSSSCLTATKPPCLTATKRTRASLARDVATTPARAADARKSVTFAAPRTSPRAPRASPGVPRASPRAPRASLASPPALRAPPRPAPSTAPQSSKRQRSEDPPPLAVALDPPPDDERSPPDDTAVPDDERRPPAAAPDDERPPDDEQRTPDDEGPPDDEHLSPDDESPPAAAPEDADEPPPAVRGRRRPPLTAPTTQQLALSGRAAAPPKAERVFISASGVDPALRSTMRQLCRSLCGGGGRARFVDDDELSCVRGSMPPFCTHLVVAGGSEDAAPRTLKVLFALARGGVSVVTPSWIAASQRSEAWVDSRWFPAGFGPRRPPAANAKLLAGEKVHIPSASLSSTEPSKAAVAQLASLCGAASAVSMRLATLVLVGDKWSFTRDACSGHLRALHARGKVLRLKWLFDSIELGSRADKAQYLPA